VKTSTALIVVAAAAAGLWLLGKQQEAALAAQLAAVPTGNALSRVVDDVVNGFVGQVDGDPCPPDQKAAGTCDVWGAKRLGELLDLEAASNCGHNPGSADVLSFTCGMYSGERNEIIKRYPGAKARFDAQSAIGTARARKAGSVIGDLFAQGSHAS
jgi:hypothetical protein